MDKSKVITAKQRHLNELESIGESYAELLKLRHRCRKMGTALGLFMFATNKRAIDPKDIRKARAYTRNILK